MTRRSPRQTGRSACDWPTCTRPPSASRSSTATTAEIRVWELGPTKAHEIRIIELVWDPPGDEVAGERVVLRSDRLQRVSLKGWTLRDVKVHTSSSPWSFVFPDVELAPGEDIVLWTKAGHADAHNLYWGLNHAVWNNVGGDTAVLSDSAGTEISRFSY